MAKYDYKPEYEKIFKLTEKEWNELPDYRKSDMIDLHEFSKKFKQWLKVIIIVGLIIFGIITFFNSIKTVPTGCVGVKTRFGKVQDNTISEGFNFKAPYIEKIILIDCKTKKIEVTSESSSKDLQTVKVTIAVNYNVNKNTANKLYKEVGTDYENIIISPAIQESIKSVMAQYTAEELITKRAEVSSKIHETLFNKIQNRGFDVTEFNITNIDFSDTFDQAIETKAVKQQEVETAKAELEKQKIQNEKEISVAEKDAEVMRLQNSQITENTLRLKELEVQQNLINKWNGQLPTTMLNDGINSLLTLNK